MKEDMGQMPEDQEGLTDTDQLRGLNIPWGQAAMGDATQLSDGTHQSGDRDKAHGTIGHGRPAGEPATGSQAPTPKRSSQPLAPTALWAVTVALKLLPSAMAVWSRLKSTLVDPPVPAVQDPFPPLTTTFSLSTPVPFHLSLSH
ncbi:hypothetical protein CRD60_08170 [Bifidobacterium aemilianum]|uniref:Uncharacterized protein n=1 Tax=Bifidobacterium aemilianum TaxID=2493120 RepID=A0A366K7U1_9BIFI|nr:hypothetical protein [Bifidobacterium aemilianum]RBP97183.1 hypothetical protein CRD60_08170 [Bifidobacterium aemilianum]